MHTPFTLSYHPEHHNEQLGGDIESDTLQAYKKQHRISLQHITDNAFDLLSVHETGRAKSRQDEE
jgi:hypothetical protein